MSKITTFLHLYISTRLSPLTASKHTAALSDEMGKLRERFNAAMKAQALQQVEAEMEELKKNIRGGAA